MLSNAAREILGIKISVSKASLALTQLNQPVSVDSNITSTSVLVHYKIHSEQKITIFRNGIETIKRFDDQKLLLFRRGSNQELCETFLKCLCWIKICTKTFLFLEWWLSEIVQLSFADSTGKYQQS